MPAKKQVKKKPEADNPTIEVTAEDCEKLGITPELVQTVVAEIVAEAKEEARQEEAAAKLQTKRTIQESATDKALITTVTEFLDNFMIIGYKLDGQPFTCRYAKNFQGNEALKSLLLQFTKAVLNSD